RVTCGVDSPQVTVGHPFPKPARSRCGQKVGAFDRNSVHLGGEGSEYGGKVVVMGAPELVGVRVQDEVGAEGNRVPGHLRNPWSLIELMAGRLDECQPSGSCVFAHDSQGEVGGPGVAGDDVGDTACEMVVEEGPDDVALIPGAQGHDKAR